MPDILILLQIPYMNYQKLLCPHHQTQQIINFCLSPDCFEGLCPTCLCEHTIKHSKMGSSPNYENIKDTQKRYQGMLRDQMMKIGSHKEWLGLIKEKIETQATNVTLTLAKARKDCLDSVNRHFDDLEAKVSNEIKEEKKKNNLHNINRFETINNLLSREFSSLVDTISSINSYKFLDLARYIQQKILPSSKQFYVQISKELKENQIYSAGIIYRSQLLPEVEASLRKLVNLQFIYPKVQLISSISKARSVAKNKENISFPIPNLSLKLNKMPIVQPIQYNLSSPLATPLSSHTKRSKLHSPIRPQQFTKRQSNQEDSRLTNESVGKLSEQCSRMAYSVYCDTGSSFFK